MPGEGGRVVHSPRRPAIRSAGPGDLARLGPVYEQAGFGPRLARVVAFAKARLDGEVVVAETGGELVGVAAGAAFEGTGWVGGVAVVPAARRVGLGAALTAEIVESLEGRGVATVLLHATDLGRPVYERLGFVPEIEYLTLAAPTRPTRPRAPAAGRAGPAGPAPGRSGPVAAAAGRPDGEPLVRPGRAADLADVLALDRAATGEDRRRLVAALWPTGGLIAADDGRPLGYHQPSPWRSGGAVLAADPGAGLDLLDAAGAAGGEAVAVSVPAANPAAVRFLEAAGFAEAFRTLRMYRGPHVPWDPAAVFAAHNLFWG